MPMTISRITPQTLMIEVRFVTRPAVAAALSRPGGRAVNAWQPSKVAGKHHVVQALGRVGRRGGVNVSPRRDYVLSAERR